MCIPIPEDFKFTPPPEGDASAAFLAEVNKRQGDGALGDNPMAVALKGVVSPERYEQYSKLPAHERLKVDDAVVFWSGTEYDDTVKRLTTVG